MCQNSILTPRGNVFVASPVLAVYQYFLFVFPNLRFQKLKKSSKMVFRKAFTFIMVLNLFIAHFFIFCQGKFTYIIYYLLFCPSCHIFRKQKFWPSKGSCVHFKYKKYDSNSGEMAQNIKKLFLEMWDSTVSIGYWSTYS